MKRAYLNLRYTSGSRAEMFAKGIRRHGYKAEFGITETPGDQDILITWNRIATANRIAKQFENRGLKVLVAENATWGNDFCGHRWFHIARKYHNTRGVYPVGDSVRFDRLGIELKPFRTKGETWILPQRGIGSKPVAMPKIWVAQVKKEYPGAKIRKHPGKRKVKPILEELENAGRVLTWGSGAAIKCLIEGIKVKSFYPEWIGQQNNTEKDRLRMLRELAWAQWQYQEIENGYAFERLLG